jgi:glucose 1-dehydrogenase
MAERVAIVTGAAGGIGRATVDLFRSEGWFVIGFDRVKAPGVDRYVKVDHSSVNELEAAFEELSDVPRIDAVINNAAIHIPNDLVATTADEWDITMATNVRAAYMVTRLAHPKMRKHGGAIVNISSVHAVATSGGVAAYATSKGALVTLTRAAALDLARDRIRVNAVLPGAVETPMLLAGISTRDRAAAIDALAGRTPMGRIGRPAEIAEVVLFLADGRRSSFITGQGITADGGALARLGSE